MHLFQVLFASIHAQQTRWMCSNLGSAHASVHNKRFTRPKTAQTIRSPSNTVLGDPAVLPLPNWPLLFVPQHRICPFCISAQEWLPPAATAVATESVVTTHQKCEGNLWLTETKLSTWQCSEIQGINLANNGIWVFLQIWYQPVSSFTAVGPKISDEFPASIWLSSLNPQHTMLPPCCRAQTWAVPHAMAAVRAPEKAQVSPVSVLYRNSPGPNHFPGRQLSAPKRRWDSTFRVAHSHWSPSTWHRSCSIAHRCTHCLWPRRLQKQLSERSKYQLVASFSRNLKEHQFLALFFTFPNSDRPDHVCIPSIAQLTVRIHSPTHDPAAVKQCTRVTVSSSQSKSLNS